MGPTKTFPRDRVRRASAGAIAATAILLAAGPLGSSSRLAHAQTGGGEWAAGGTGAEGAPGNGTAPNNENEGGAAGGAEPRVAPACPQGLRCPDMIMSAPSHLHLDRTTMPGHLLLRAASSLDNHGSGPLELRAHRTGRYGTVVYQAIYGRHGKAHMFRTKAKLVFKYIPGYRYGHPSVGNFSYWKLEHAAAFQLWSVDAHFKALRLVRTGPKVDYCLRDLTRTFPSNASPREAVYPACDQDPSMRRDVLGTSVGWSDVYPYEYPQQWIDVTGLKGRFAYVQIADPDNLLRESDHENNVSETYVQLPSGRVLGHRVAVSSP
jgi:Lysyl oxidase